MSDKDTEIERLFEGLAPRRPPPEPVRTRAFSAAYEVFLEARAERARRRRTVLALAATVVVAVLAGTLIDRRPAAFTIEIADARALTLDGTAIGDENQAIEVVSGSMLRAAEPARLALGRATDLRLNAGTTIRWIDPASFELERGIVFVDTGEQDDMRVVTTRGVVSDIGTQFLVALEDDVLEVAVRAGRTVVESDLGTYRAGADGARGDVLTLSRSQATSRTEPASAARWEWIHSVPRGYRESRVAALLDAIARDLGLRLEYADAGTRAWVMNLTLEGDDLERLSPEQALEVLASTTNLGVSRADPEVLSVSMQ